MIRYNARWGWKLKLASVLIIIFCLGIAAIAFWIQPDLVWVTVLPLAILLIGVLFVIRGYAIGPDAILVHRLLWDTRIPLAGLHAAEFVPNAMRWSLRTFGNGGLYSFCGYFWNKTLGPYRAFVTDTHNTVVLRFATRTVVLSPEFPLDFVEEIRGMGIAPDPV